MCKCCFHDWSWYLVQEICPCFASQNLSSISGTDLRQRLLKIQSENDSKLRNTTNKLRKLDQRLLAHPYNTEANETQTPISTKLRLLKKRFSEIGTGHCDPNTLDLDRMLYNLQSGANGLLYEKDIIMLCRDVRKLIFKESILLELTAPIKIMGDIHGQFCDLLRLFKAGHAPATTKYLFLGDYVDRGQQSLESICLLFAYKLKYPKNIHLLRGNHEDASINRIYGFYDECKRKHSVKLWKVFTDCFNCLPVAALINKQIFCMHGGLSPELHCIQQIRRISRPIEVPPHGLLCDLLWSDPTKQKDEWGPNSRGCSFSFGKSVVTHFLKNQSLDLIVRAHEVVEDGYEFFADRQLVTVFSAPNYLGEFENSGAILCVDEKLKCSFIILKARKMNKPNKQRLAIFTDLSLF